jgi:hypothetical protein
MAFQALDNASPTGCSRRIVERNADNPPELLPALAVDLIGFLDFPDRLSLVRFGDSLPLQGVGQLYRLEGFRLSLSYRTVRLRIRITTSTRGRTVPSVTPFRMTFPVLAIDKVLLAVQDVLVAILRGARLQG